jgi:hypothetical protein
MEKPSMAGRPPIVLSTEEVRGPWNERFATIAYPHPFVLRVVVWDELKMSAYRITQFGLMFGAAGRCWLAHPEHRAYASELEWFRRARRPRGHMSEAARAITPVSERKRR